jgi:2-polyprenyl-3-methyl-5-hydroxy-6-metoxy-1,4-benzoquinol methylase
VHTFSGADALEVGCGDGRMSWRFADRARSVLALDPDASAIEQARASLSGLPERLRLRVHFQVADMTGVRSAPTK